MTKLWEIIQANLANIIQCLRNLILVSIALNQMNGTLVDKALVSGFCIAQQGMTYQAMQKPMDIAQTIVGS